MRVTLKGIYSALEAFANLIDLYRTIPRLLLLVYIYMVYVVSIWFMDLSEPNAAQSAFASVIWGTGAAWLGLYLNSKRSVETIENKTKIEQDEPT